MTEYSEFCEKLEMLIDAQRERVILQYAEQLQNSDPEQKGLSFYYKEAKKHVDAKWTNLNDKLSIVSGRKTSHLINAWVKTNYGVNCSQEKIIYNIEPADIDAEMIEVIRALCT